MGVSHQFWQPCWVKKDERNDDDNVEAIRGEEDKQINKMTKEIGVIQFFSSLQTIKSKP
jgi:fructose-1,6-bisphosphatase